MKLVPPVPDEPSGEPFVLTASNDLPKIARERYLLFITQLMADWKLSERAVLKRLATDPTYAASLRQAPDKGVGLNAIAKAYATIGLSPQFFFVETADEVDYKDWLVTVLERDEERSPYPIFEAFIAAMRSLDAMTGAQIAELRAVRYDAGERMATIDAAREEFARIVREQSTRALRIASTTKPSRADELKASGKAILDLEGRKKR